MCVCSLRRSAKCQESGRESGSAVARLLIGGDESICVSCRFCCGKSRQYLQVRLRVHMPVKRVFMYMCVFIFLFTQSVVYL